MKIFTLIALAVFGVLCLPHNGEAQGTLTPLDLFTVGNGSITPFQNGQLLEVGQNYEMTAIPDPGFDFSSWQPVEVFTYTAFQLDYINGNVITNTISNVFDVAAPTYTTQPVLDFTMQAVTNINDNPGISTLTESSGWQANFEAVPEPSIMAMMACGLTVIVLFRRRSTSDRTLTFFPR
jgi:hypothetical protein